MKNKKKFKNKVFTVLMALIVSASSIPFGLGLGKVDTDMSVYAYTKTEITVDNGDFNSTSTSSYPKTASNWTKADGSSVSTALKAGVISTNLDTFKDEYKSYSLAIDNTTGLENSKNGNVYMINAIDKASRYGIKSNTVTLDKESYYMVSIDVKTSLPVLKGDTTLNLSSMASIYLNISDDDNLYSFVGIDTQNGWDKYTFYIHTNKFIAPTMNLELWLGSKTEILSSGAVIFDNVKAYKLAEADWKAVADQKNKIIELDDATKYDATSKINNASFEDTSAVWDIVTNEKNTASNISTGICSIVSYNPQITNIKTSPNTNGVVGNNYALFINNEEEAGVAYKSNTFKIEKYSNYLIQVYVKTGSFEKGGATISLVPTNEDLSATKFTDIQTSTTKNSITNNWEVYNIYVQGSPFADEEVYLQLGVGSDEEDDLVKGYAFFDDIRVSKITFNDYTNASTSSTNVKQAKLHNISSSSEISNAYFNFVDDAFTGSFPMQPSGWTATNSDSKETSGIISTRKDDFESKTNEYYGNLPWYAVGLTPLQTNVDENTADNNLLMIRNANYDMQSYKSSSYTLSSSSFYKVSVDARTLSTDNAFINIMIGGNVVAKYEFKSEDKWTTIETYFATGLGTKEVSVELGLGTSKNLVKGYAFFDNVRVSTLESDAFTEIKKDESKKVIDFSKEDFSMTTGEFNEDLEIPSNWTIENSSLSNVLFGIEKTSDTNALVISTTTDTANIKAQSSITYNLDTETYYIATFKIKTSAFTDLKNSGATFGFKEISNSYFKHIVSASEDYVEYKFFINGANYSTLTPYFELDVENATNGEFAKLSSIEFEATTETKFTEKVKELEDDDTIKDVIILGTVTEEDDNNDSGKTNYVGGNLDWYLIPTIITTLAMILAVIGVLIQWRKKKAVKKEKQKKFMNKYDREITLHKALIDREAEAIRKQKLEELKAKLKLVDNELEQIENDYKQKSNDANANQEHEFKKYARNRKKVAERKEKLEEEKRYVQSDEFLKEATDKVIETYEPESHEQEVAELKQSSEELSTQNEQASESENAESVATESEQTSEQTESNAENKASDEDENK